MAQDFKEIIDFSLDFPEVSLDKLMSGNMDSVEKLIQDPDLVTNSDREHAADLIDALGFVSLAIRKIQKTVSKAMTVESCGFSCTQNVIGGFNHLTAAFKRIEDEAKNLLDIA